MTKEEKIELLEETMDLEEGTLSEDMRLEDLAEWDSITKLAIIVMIDDEFDKTITANDIKKFIFVKDIIEIME